MSRAAYVRRAYRCLRCHGAPADRMHHYRYGFWSVSPGMRNPEKYRPTFRDLSCPDCGANPAWFEPWPKVCSQFLMPLRDDLRPVVFEWRDQHGIVHYRYPSSTDASQTTDALPRDNERKVDFPTLRSLEVFLKEQNPNHRDWQVPLNDILDYDEARIDLPALDDSDPGAAEDAEDIRLVEDSGTLTRDEAETLMSKDPSEARALIEKV